MLIKNSETHYGQVARVLHWTSVVLLVTAFIYGDQSAGLEDGAEKSSAIAQHISYGLLLLAIMLSRFAWRQHNHNPVESYRIARWQKFTALGVHWFIYSAVVVQCLLGMIQSDLLDVRLGLFEVLWIPPLLADNPEAGERLGDVHAALSNLILVALTVHITAAIYHQIFGVLEPEDPMP